LRAGSSWTSDKPKLDPIEAPKPELEPEIIKPWIESWIFPIPDNIEKINQILSIVKSNPGDQKVVIGTKEILVSETGKSQIESLY
jgi:hypothetical protein